MSRYIFLVVFFLLMNAYAAASSSSFLIKKMQIKIEGSGQENFDNLYAKYIGKNISLEGIDDEIIEYFTEQDYLFPEVSIAQEDLKNGFLNINVKMTNIDEVIIYTNEEDKPLINEYAQQIAIEKPARIKTVQKYIALMNRIPGYNVQYEFKPSEVDGEVDLVLQITKAKAEIYTSSDSYGDSDFGEMQNVVSAQVFSPFGGNDSWTTYGVTTNHPDRFYSIGMNYNRIINNYGTSLNLAISRSESNSTFDDIVTTKNGIDNSYSSSLNHPLYLDENQIFEGEIGTTYKTSKGYTADVNVARPNARGQRIRDSVSLYSRPDIESRYWAANTTLRYISADKAGGHNNVNLNFAQGMGGSFRNYTDAQDVPDERYNVTTFDISRDQSLPNNFSIFSQIMAGHSDYKLPDQEVFILGGRDFGRGYDSGILSGNKLLASSIELRYNKEMDEDPLFQTIQPYIFRDMGYVGKQASNTNISHLSSYGAGIRFMLTHNAEVDLEIAEPMKKTYVVEGTEYKAQTNIGITGSKSFRF